MKIHNVDLYHCQKCGKVTRREGNVAAPECCGQRMTKAASETVSAELPPGAPAVPGTTAAQNPELTTAGK